jgi:peptidyl-prolyl cis-trans isomerase A (cyclophilin A)
MSKTPRFVENLEGRQLLAAGPRVSSVSADNRGEVQINLTEAVTGVNSKSVRMFLAGPDDVVGTADDVNANAEVSYVSSKRRIVVKKDLAPGTGYRVRVNDTVVSSTTGERLDGEFLNNGRSGNGTAGGSYSFQAKNDRGSNPRARFYFNIGSIDLVLYRAQVKTTVDNFTRYIDAGLYNGTIVHRSESLASAGIGVIQGGGYTSSNAADRINNFDPIPLQSAVAGLSNVRGTIAMARTSVPASATSEYFFNTTPNTVLDGTTAGADGYAVFGYVLNNNGLGVMQAINDLPVAAEGSFNRVPQFNGGEVVLVKAAQLMRISSI